MTRTSLLATPPWLLATLLLGTLSLTSCGYLFQNKGDAITPSRVARAFPNFDLRFPAATRYVYLEEYYGMTETITLLRAEIPEAALADFLSHLPLPEQGFQPDRNLVTETSTSALWRVNQLTSFSSAEFAHPDNNESLAITITHQGGDGMITLYLQNYYVD